MAFTPPSSQSGGPESIDEIEARGVQVAQVYYTEADFIRDATGMTDQQLTDATKDFGAGVAKETGKLAVGLAVPGGRPAATTAAAAGKTVARNPTVYVNATDFSINLARGAQQGRNLNVLSRPLGSSPGAWLGHGAGVVYGVSSRLGGVVTGAFGP